MLARLGSMALAFAVGAGASLVAARPQEATRPGVRLAAVVARDAEWVDDDERAAWRAAAARHVVGRYGVGRVERVWRIDPQAGFPGGRIVDGFFPHDATCEADREDLRVITLHAPGARAASIALVNAWEPRRVQVLRAGGDAALVVLQGRTFRAGSSVELLAWDLARGTVDEVGRWTSGGDVSWSLEVGDEAVIHVRGATCCEMPADLQAELDGLRIVVD